MGIVRAEEGRIEIGRLFCNYMQIHIKMVCDIQTSIKIEGTFVCQEWFCNVISLTGS